MPGLLTHAPEDIVRRLLIAMGLGSDPPSEPWPVYVGGEPDLPPDVISVYGTLGRQHGRDTVTRERAEHQGIQVKVRSAEYGDGAEKANQIAIAFDQDVLWAQVTINAVTYRVQSVNRTSPMLPLTKEALTAKRPIFAVNALISVRQLS